MRPFFCVYDGVSDQYMSNQIFRVIGQQVFIVVISDPTYMEMKKKYGKASYAICNLANKQRKTRWLYLVYRKLPHDKVV